MFGGGHHFLDFLDACEDGAESDEFGAREARDQSSERGFAAARWTPQQHGGDFVVFDLLAQRFAGAKEFFLADEFIERARAHALGERLVRGVFRHWLWQLGKKTHVRYEFSIEDGHGVPCPYGRGWRWRAAS